MLDDVLTHIKRWVEQDKAILSDLTETNFKK